MRVAFGTDDQNECVNAVLDVLRELTTLEVVGSGTQWPDFSKQVAQRVANGEADFGVLMCWTGTGTAMAANKIHGARAVTAWDPWIAAKAREWNNANVLALSTRRTAPEVAVECVRAFLNSEVDPGEIHTISQLE